MPSGSKKKVGGGLDNWGRRPPVGVGSRRRMSVVRLAAASGVALVS